MRIDTLGNVHRDEKRRCRAKQKYKKVEGGKWVIDTSKDNGSVRPIDLVSRDPDRLREFDSNQAAVTFEEECYQEAERLKAAGEDWSKYRYIPRKQLTIPEAQRQLHDSLVAEIRDGNRDVADTVNARSDEQAAILRDMKERLEELKVQADAKSRNKGGKHTVAFLPKPDGDRIKNDKGYYCKCLAGFVPAADNMCGCVAASSSSSMSSSPSAS